MREYRFHEFVLQVEQRRLLGGNGATIDLPPRLFDALLYLVERAGELLEKDRLLTELWPGLVVEENSLNKSVSALRKLLGDDAQRGRFIQTVPRRGFRFVAPVEVIDVPSAVPDFRRQAAPGDDRLDGAAPLPLPELGSNRRTLIAVATGALVLAATSGIAWRWRQARDSPPPGGPSTLAILPFKPIATGARDELLEMGMAESLIARLSNLPGVAVRSVGSVRRFGGAEQDPIAAARELNVAWIVDGSIQRAGDRMRVTARLLNTISGEAAWSGLFDEQFTGMFELQDSISMKVAQVLAPHLGDRGQRRLAGTGGTRSVDAYQLYLTARQLAQGIKTAGLVKSVDLYRQAIAIDPTYALAYSGMGESYRRMVFGADGEPKVVLDAARKCTERAVQLDPDLADGHAGMGWNLFWRDWDWAAAAAAFDRALALNPNEANAHLGYSQLLETLGRNSDAVEHLRRARESDPLSLILLTLESASLIDAGRAEEARQRLQRVFDIEPDFWVAHMVQSYLFLVERKPAEAIESMVRADRLSDGSSQPAASLGYLLARKGQPERARVVLERLTDLAKTRYVPPTSTGLIYAGLGDKEATLASLEKGLLVHDVRMTLVRQDARWNLVADDARYQSVMRQLKLV